MSSAASLNLGRSQNGVLGNGLKKNSSWLNIETHLNALFISILFFPEITFVNLGFIRLDHDPVNYELYYCMFLTYYYYAERNIRIWACLDFQFAPWLIYWNTGLYGIEKRTRIMKYDLYLLQQKSWKQSRHTKTCSLSIVKTNFHHGSVVCMQLCLVFDKENSFYFCNKTVDESCAVSLESATWAAMSKVIFFFTKPFRHSVPFPQPNKTYKTTTW